MSSPLPPLALTKNPHSRTVPRCDRQRTVLLARNCLCAHFADEEMETQRGSAAYLRSHSLEAGKARFDSVTPWCRLENETMEALSCRQKS
jgi:hypothetical protein